MQKHQTFEKLQKISENKILKFFLEKPYSLELLFILFFEKKIEGLENTYQNLKSPKPKYPAFKTYIDYLVQKKCIKIEDGKTKKSSKILSLTDQVNAELLKINS